MAAQGVVTLNTADYNPRGKQGDIAKWILVDDPSYGGGNSTLTESVRDPSGKDAMYRIRFHLDVPKTATDDTACSCAGTELSKGSADIYVTVPSNFSSSERQVLRLRIQSLISNAVFVAAVDDLEGAW